MKKNLALLLMIVLLLTGCGSKSASAEATADNAMGGLSVPAEPAGAPPDPSPSLPTAPQEAPMAEAEIAYDTADAPASEEQPVQRTLSTEKLIYRADLSIETLDFDAAVASLERLAGAMGGFIESSNVSGNTSWQPDGTTRIVDRWANYTIRVPAERFQEAVNQAGSLGSVTSSGTQVENITSQFTDQEARQHSLEVQEERLLEMLGKAENIDTLIMLESRLSEVRYEIESIERQLRLWQNQVDYSTISIQLQEVAVYTPTTTVQRTFSERMSLSLRDGWAQFVRGLEDLSLALAGSLPALVLLAVVAVVAVVVVRKILRRRRKKSQPVRSDSQTEDGETK